MCGQTKLIDIDRPIIIFLIIYFLLFCTYQNMYFTTSQEIPSTRHSTSFPDNVRLSV